MNMYKIIEAAIDQNRRCVLAVGGDPDMPPFSYTVGNHLLDLPELLVIGLADNALLNEMSDKMILASRPFEDGELVSLGGKFPVKVITCGRLAKSGWTIQAGQYFRTEDYDLMQVLIPDIAGRFPPDPHVHPSFAVPCLTGDATVN